MLNINQVSTLRYLQSSKNLFFRFLFPLFPVKIFTSLHLILFLAFLVGLRLLLGLFSVPIAPFGFSISFAWIAVYVAGFFYGPVIGIFFGAIMDTISFLVYGGVWFWMYAIQEPFIGVIAGIIGSLYSLKLFKSFKWQILVQKICVYGFAISIIVVLITQFKNISNGIFQKSDMNNVMVFSITAVIFMLIFLIINEFQNWTYYSRHKKKLNDKQEYSIYLYISFLMIICTMLFSFLLGPISYVKYLEYINGVEPSKYLEYGNMYYLIPRILKESIKTPVYIIIMMGIIFALKDTFNNFLSIAKNSW